MRRILDTVTMLDKGDLLAAAWVGGDRAKNQAKELKPKEPDAGRVLQTGAGTRVVRTLRAKRKRGRSAPVGRTEDYDEGVLRVRPLIPLR